MLQACSKRVIEDAAAKGGAEESDGFWLSMSEGSSLARRARDSSDSSDCRLSLMSRWSRCEVMGICSAQLPSQDSGNLSPRTPAQDSKEAG